MVRFKNRYLLAEVLSFRDGPQTEQEATQNQNVASFTKDELATAIKESIKLNFGDFGLGCLFPAMQIKYFSQATGSFIIRCARSYARMLWASLTLMTQVGKQKVLIRVRHVGGTIRACQLQLIKLNRDYIKAAAESSAVVQPDDMDVDADE